MVLFRRSGHLSRVGSYWIPWFAVGIAAAFMGLIVRVIKNVVAKAVSLQDDADFTI